MARIRSIKPEFATSEAIVALSIQARLHFALLWTYSDDAGRGVDNPRLIKAACWPLDDDVTATEVERLQAELADNGRIVRYEVDGKRYYEVANWSEHQKPQHPKPSTLPPPPDTSHEDFMTPHENVMTPHEASSEMLPVVVVGEGEVVGEVEEREPAPPDVFDTFWTRYPRKVAKPRALAAWKKATKRTDADLILDGLDPWLSYWGTQSDEQYIPHPTTWLNGERWNDKPPSRAQPSKRRAAEAEFVDSAQRFLANTSNGNPLAAITAGGSRGIA